MTEKQFLIGLVVDRLEPSSPWGGPIWLPVQAIDGAPVTEPWTELARSEGRLRFFAGAFPVHLYSTDTTFYRDNLAAERPRLWVVMTPPAEADLRIGIIAITADPTEGEGYAQTGTNIVEVVDIPPGLAGEIASFVAELHVDRPFEKRKRDKRPPEMLGRRRPVDL